MVGILTNNSTSDLITPERQAIVDLEILELSKRLRSGDLDPLDVLHAYWVMQGLKLFYDKRLIGYLNVTNSIAAQFLKS